MFGGSIAPVLGGGGGGGGGRLGRGLATQARRSADITAIETATDIGTDPLDAGAKAFKAPTGAQRIVRVGINLLSDLGSGNTQDSYMAYVSFGELTNAKGGLVLASNGQVINAQGTSTATGVMEAGWVWFDVDIPVDGGAGPTVTGYITGTAAAATGSAFNIHVMLVYA